MRLLLPLLECMAHFTPPECPPAGRLMYSLREPPSSDKPPPREMPTHLASAFTRCGSAQVEEYYVDDSFGGQGSHYIYSERDIKSMIERANQLSLPSSKMMRARHRDKWIFDALDKFSVSGSVVVVIGSANPWFEAIAISQGASSVVTVEYNKLTYHHALITTVTSLSDAAIAVAESAGDSDVVVFSISSLDHDGLGRYGDPIAPDGDLLTMDDIRITLQPKLFFVTVPIGPVDVVAWNLHRCVSC